MTDTSEVLEKLRKLLRLSKSENIHEAAAAAAAAQRLMSRHAIDSSMVDPAGQDQAEEAFGNDFIYTCSGILPSWVLTLGYGVVEAIRLRGSYNSTRAASYFRAWGPLDQIAMARETMGWLSGEIERLCTEDMAKRSGMGRAYWTAWRLGCAQTIAARLEAEAEKVREERLRELGGPSAADYEAAAGDAEKLVALDSAPRYALAVVETAIAKIEARPERIKKWMEGVEGIKLTAGRARTCSSADGMTAGRRAGKRASLASRAKLTGGDR